MLHRNIHTVDVTQNAAAQVFYGAGKILDFRDGSAKQLIESSPHHDIVGSDGGQYTGMRKRPSKGFLQLSHSRKDPRINQRIEVLESYDLFAQRFELPKQLDMFFGQKRSVGVSKDFDQRDLKGRKGQRSIESVATTFPLTWDARMA